MAACLVVVLTVLVLRDAGTARRDHDPNASPEAARQLFLARVQEKIRKREPIVLLGDQGLPEWYQAVSGVVKLQESQSPLSISSDDAMLLDLLPTEPWESFRLCAEVRLKGRIDTQGGIFLGCQRRDMQFRPACWFTYLGRKDLPETDEVVLYNSLMHRKEGHEDNFYLAFPTKLFGNMAPNPGNWVSLSVNATPDQIEAFYNAMPLGQLPWSAMNKWMDQHISIQKRSNPHLVWEPVRLSPRGSLGLFVNRGEAAFRRVVVEPLD
jgi:hypothetical protein